MTRSAVTSSAASWRWCCARRCRNRLDAKGHVGLEWARILDDLVGLQEIELTLQGKGYRLRTESKGTISALFGACGGALPPTLRPM